MKNLKWIAPSVLALCVASSGALKASAHEAAPVSGSASALTQDRDRWEDPPADYRDAQQQGYHEGIEAARHDFREHRHADVDDHDMYKHPPVEGEARKEFRAGFREGYSRAMDHMKHEQREYDRDDRPHF